MTLSLQPSFRRKPESSAVIQYAVGFVLLRRIYLSNWIPACAGMTRFVIYIINHIALNNQLD